MLLFLLLFASLALVQSGKVTPIGRTPIKLSSNNVNEISSYTFNFVITTPTVAGDLLVITPPQSQYSHLTASSCVAYLHAETFIPTQTTLPCSYTADNQFVITLVELNNGLSSPHAVTILDIQNPSTVGGTGNFEVQTRRGLANVLDLNGAFNQVGFVAAPTALAATVSITANSVVNLNGTYQVDIVTAKTVPQKGLVLLTFPPLSKIFADFTCSVTPTAGTCARLDAQTVRITDFTADVTAGTSIVVILTKILNIDYVASAGSFKVQTWTNAVSTILEQVTLPLTTTQAGTIATATTSYTNFFQSGLSLVPNDYTSYEISFRIVNPVPVGGSIQITFPMTPDYCVPYSGLNDVSESQPSTCSISGSVATITSFSKLSANQLLIVLLRATNPSSTGATSSVVIRTYKDNAGTQLIDQLTTGLSFTISSSLTIMKSLSYTLSTLEAFQTGTWTINFQSPTQFTSPGTYADIQISLPTGFSFAGTETCTLTPAGGSATTVTCSYASGVLTLSTSSVTGTFSNTADNTLTITGSSGGIKNPKAGDYNILFKFTESSGGTHSQSQLITITAATTLAVTVSPLTLDRAKYTLYEISFTAPETLSAGVHPNDVTTAQSHFVLDFQTNTGTVLLFANDLGRSGDTTTGSTIPCYGADNLKPYATNGKLRCKIFFATTSSATTPVTIEVYDYASITSGQLVTLQLPKILNPDSMTNAAQITFSILNTQNHITKTYYTTTITLSTMVLDAVVKSPYNTNGVNSASTNIAPTFNPSTINMVSRGEVKLTPGASRNLAIGNKLIIKFPLVSATTPQAYIFDSTTTCSIGLSTQQPCLVFPEVGWIVIKSLASAFNTGQEYSIMISNVKNPPAALSFTSVLYVTTVASPSGITREYEEFIYTSFSAFKPGGLSNINVFPSSYEANAVDVEYQWIFVVSNPIPAGGSIQLTFPPNVYSLDSDPPVTGEVIRGLTDLSPSNPISFTFVINVVTVKNFAAVSSGTLIRVLTKGVKNPIEATRTTNFAIKTMNPEGNTIDSNTIIPGLNILQANPTGVVVFNYFYTTPGNGKTLGNYYLSFYPQTSYPKGTTIQVIFPYTEFNPSNFQSDTCVISGALTTFESCTRDSNGITFEIITDVRLEIEAGMEPINLFFPRIENFNEELNSGVVIVRALYDGVTLDESGNSEDNRKATSSLMANSLTFSDFSYAPQTEGQSATYQVKLFPSVEITQSTVIQFQFPEAFTYGLGETVNCQVPDLQISTDSPIQCTVEGQVVNITNFKAFDPAVTTTGFVVSIGGIINPNKVPAVTGNFSVFLLTTETYASEWIVNLGALAFTQAPQIMDMTAFSSSTALTRTLGNYAFTLVPTVSITIPSTLTAEYSSEYSLETFSKLSTLSINGGTAASTLPIGNFMIKTLTAAITSGTSFTLGLNNLANPFDEGEKRYPTVYIQDEGSATVEVTVRTYDNLIKPDNIIFTHGGEIIILNDDKPATIFPGQTNQYKFVFQSPTTQLLTIQALPLISAFVDVQDIQVPIGSTEALIWVGVPSGTPNGVVYIEWKIVGDTINRFWAIRPFQINIVSGQTEVFVDEIVHVPAGGRTDPCYITLSNSPLNDLVVQLYQRGTVPSYVNVYPSKLIFRKGELTKPFWVSSGTETTGISGSIIFLLNGTNKNAFFMPKRYRTFIVTRGDTLAPQVTAYSMDQVTENSATFSFKTNEPSTILYFVAPKGSYPPQYRDVKDKKSRYDYYAAQYVVGEYVNDTANNAYTFDVTGLRPNMQYDAYFFAEDMSGNVAPQAPIYNISTDSDPPQQVTINVLMSTLSDTELFDLLTTISEVTGIDQLRFETDLTVLTAKSGGDTTNRYTTSDLTNVRTKQSYSAATTPSVAAGTTKLSFIIFPDVNNPFTPSNSQSVALITSGLDAINAAFNGGNKINTAYGVKSSAVEPDNIRWGSGSSATMTAGYTNITITGVSLNAAGTIHAVAYASERSAFYSTQQSYVPVVRYLREEDEEIVEREGRSLTSLYGQQTCVQSEINEFDGECSGADLPSADSTRSDVAFSYNATSPSSYQVVRESDGAYFKGDSIGRVTVAAGETATISLDGLKEGTNYTVYLSATDGYSKYPERLLDEHIITQLVTTLKHVELDTGAPILSIGFTTMILSLLAVFAM